MTEKRYLLTETELLELLEDRYRLSALEAKEQLDSKVI